jgi:hypothetical protein
MVEGDVGVLFLRVPWREEVRARKTENVLVTDPVERRREVGSALFEFASWA